MKVDSIVNGIVIDHITAGSAMRLYELLRLESYDCSVAILMNVVSSKMGRKDIIKLDAEVPLNFDVVGYVDPGATINIIREGKLVEKRSIDMPELLQGVIRCKNPRCISSVEQELPQVFKLTDRVGKVYRCIYCETKAE